MAETPSVSGRQIGSSTHVLLSPAVSAFEIARFRLALREFGLAGLPAPRCRSQLPEVSVGNRRGGRRRGRRGGRGRGGPDSGPGPGSGGGFPRQGGTATHTGLPHPDAHPDSQHAPARGEFAQHVPHPPHPPHNGPPRSAPDQSGQGGHAGHPANHAPHHPGIPGAAPHQPNSFHNQFQPGTPHAPQTQRKRFEDLTVIDPQPRLTLEYRGCPDSCRLIDLFCPLGRGQRALIVSPPKAGKTTLLKDIAGGISRNHPDVELIALLVDERPEEVTDFKRYFESLGGAAKNARVIASSNDHGIDKHIQISLQTLDDCKRAVEQGRHLVVVLDSITRLSRAFNNSRRYATSGRTMTGGLDAKSMEMPRQIFGSARNTEDAGSLTIIGTCLVDTGSAMDQVIFEEFKGSGNMELVLDRKIAERRMFPAINLAASGTRKEHLMMGEQELKTVTALRRRLMATPPHVQVEQLLAAMKRFPTNAEMVGAAAG